MLFNEPKLLKRIRIRIRTRIRIVSVLFNEPKLLKSPSDAAPASAWRSFSALQRAEIAEIDARAVAELMLKVVSVLFNEPKLLKF